MSKRNIALITRPIHLLNVYEYLNLKKGATFDIYVEPNSNAGERKAILDSLYLLKIHPNIKIHKNRLSIRFELLSLLFFYLKIWIHSIKGIEYNEILLSTSPKARVCYKLLKMERVIFMDEGISSLKIFPALLKNINPFGSNYKYKSFLYITYKVLGLAKIDKILPFSIFTIYDELLDGANRVTLNDFFYVRQLFQNCEIQKGTVLILGTYFKSLMTKEKFTEKIKKVLAPLNYKRLVYKHHKLENKEIIDIQFMEVLETNLPIEYYFFFNAYFPEYVISFDSSVGQVLKKINSEVKLVNCTLY